MFYTIIGWLLTAIGISLLLFVKINVIVIIIAFSCMVFGLYIATESGNEYGRLYNNQSETINSV